MTAGALTSVTQQTFISLQPKSQLHVPSSFLLGFFVFTQKNWVLRSTESQSAALENVLLRFLGHI